LGASQRENELKTTNNKEEEYTHYQRQQKQPNTIFFRSPLPPFHFYWLGRLSFVERLLRRSPTTTYFLSLLYIYTVYSIFIIGCIFLFLRTTTTNTPHFYVDIISPIFFISTSQQQKAVIDVSDDNHLCQANGAFGVGRSLSLGRPYEERTTAIITLETQWGNNWKGKKTGERERARVSSRKSIFVFF
jgi:hypothetical protein